MNVHKITVGEDFKLRPIFQNTYDEFSPESGDINYVVRNPLGEIINNGTVAFNEDVLIPASIFTLPDNSVMGNAFITFTFTDYPLRINDRVEFSRFIPLLYSGEDVQRLLGAQDTEIQLSSINLLETYQSLIQEFGDVFFKDQNRLQLENKLILYRAALELLPTLELRLLQEEKVDDHSEKRVNINFELLGNKLSTEYYRIVGGLFGYETYSEPLISLVATTNLITGV